MEKCTSNNNYDSTVDSIKKEKICRALVTIQALSYLQFVLYGGERNLGLVALMVATAKLVEM